MENAAQAIKMAAFVMIFVGALSIAMYSLTKARTTTETILQSSNDRNFYSYVDEDDYIASSSEFRTERIVQFDSILPTLYRYYKENYRIEFYQSDGTTGIGLYTPRNQIQMTNVLDIDIEMQNNEYWQGSSQATKENLDKIITNELWRYEDRSFKEELGIVETNDSDNELLEDINKQTKRVIRYTLVN